MTMEITNNINTTNSIGAHEHVVLFIWLVYDDDRVRVWPTYDTSNVCLAYDAPDMWREIDHASRPRPTQHYIKGWVALIIDVRYTFFCGHDGRDRRHGANGFWIT